MRAVPLFTALLLAGGTAYLAPLAPALRNHLAVPQKPTQAQALVLAGVTPEYVGYHTRGPERFEGLTDTILVLYYLPGENLLKVVSVPRDTLVQVPGWGGSKVNSANVRGGPPMMKQVIGNLVGVPIEGVVLVSLDGVHDVTEAIGGVTLDVPQEMQYEDTAAKLHIDLHPGVQHLNAEQAEGFLRFRHDRLGDIGRVQRQQQFLRAFMDQLKSPAGLYRLPQVLAAGYNNMRIDLPREVAARWYGVALAGPRLEMAMLPGQFANYGASFWDPDERAIQKLFRDRTTMDPRAAKVVVMNVGAPAGSARRLRDRLEGMGYQNVQVTDLRDGNPSESVLISTTGPQVAQRIQQDAGQLEVRSSDEGVQDADITIKLGQNWQE